MSSLPIGCPAGGDCERGVPGSCAPLKAPRPAAPPQRPKGRFRVYFFVRRLRVVVFRVRVVVFRDLDGLFLRVVFAAELALRVLV